MERRLLTHLAVLMMLALLGGCASSKPPPQPQKLSIGQLEQLTYVFADRYMTLITTACDQIARDNPNPQQRLMAARVKLINCSSIYDIATSPDVFSRLLDLTLVVTLQSEVWIDDGRARDQFGDRSTYLEQALRQARRDIWRIAEQAMTLDQVDGFDRMILRWRRQNPNVEFVSYVRFNDVATGRARTIAASIRRGEGMLAPIDEAKQSVDAIRLLSERVFYLTKRMPFILDWQGDVIVEQALQKPEVQTFVNRINDLPKGLTSQRQALSEDLGQRLRDVDSMAQQRIDQAIKQGKGVVGFTAIQAVMLCGIFFVSLLIYSVIVNWVRGRWGPQRAPRAQEEVHR